MIRRLSALLSVLILSGCMAGGASNPDRPNTCNELADILDKDKLNEFFEAAPNRFIQGCNNNPRRTALWRQDPAQPAKLEAYCKISPVFRACFVCDRLAHREDVGMDPNHRRSYMACKRHLRPEDRQHADKIWER